jgi:hypothetical protein
LRETKNHPHTSEGIIAMPAACRNAIQFTVRDAQLTSTDGILAGAASLVARARPRLESPAIRSRSSANLPLPGVYF